MTAQNIVRIDGIKWWIVTAESGIRTPVALCPDHHLRLTPVPVHRYDRGRSIERHESYSVELQCAEGNHKITMPREYGAQKKYVIDRIDAKVFAGMQTLSLDDEAVPVAKAKAKSADDKYFVTAQLMDSKRGLQAVVYAGEKGKEKKSQIFIEPKMKRLSFDQKDIHPSDVFLKLEATFDDGSKASIKQADDKEK